MTMTANADLLKVIAKINKKMGDDTIVLGEEIRDNVISRMTTGSIAFDVALGGGWPTNQWHELIGEASNGKTAMQRNNGFLRTLKCAGSTFLEFM